MKLVHPIPLMEIVFSIDEINFFNSRSLSNSGPQSIPKRVPLKRPYPLSNLQINNYFPVTPTKGFLPKEPPSKIHRSNSDPPSLLSINCVDLHPSRIPLSCTTCKSSSHLARQCLNVIPKSILYTCPKSGVPLCFYCRLPHNVADCPKLPKIRELVPQIFCQHCFSPSHSLLDCPSFN